MIRRNTIVLGALAAVSLFSVGCTFYARSPQQYRDDTAKVLESKNAEINTCYDAVLKTTPAASGKVTVTFTVEEKTGKIIDTKAEPARTTAAQPLIDCVVNALNGLMLQPPDQRKGNATFEYDFSAPAAPVAAAAAQP